MNVNAIPTSRALQLTQDRVLEILHLKLSSGIDAETGRSGDPPLTDEGLYLPDPDRYIRQNRPDQQEMLEVQNVACYIGQTGDSNYGEYRNLAGGERLVNVTVPYAASIVFGVAAGAPAVADPVTGEELAREEVVERRAQAYTDCIGYTLSKWGKVGSGSDERANAVSSINEQGDFTTVLRFSFGSDDSSELRGIGSFQFQVEQWHLLPAHATT